MMSALCRVPACRLQTYSCCLVSITCCCVSQLSISHCTNTTYHNTTRTLSHLFATTLFMMFLRSQSAVFTKTTAAAGILRAAATRPCSLLSTSGVTGSVTDRSPTRSHKQVRETARIRVRMLMCIVHEVHVSACKTPRTLLPSTQCPARQARFAAPGLPSAQPAPRPAESSKLLQKPHQTRPDTVSLWRNARPDTARHGFLRTPQAEWPCLAGAVLENIKFFNSPTLPDTPPPGLPTGARRRWKSRI